MAFVRLKSGKCRTLSAEQGIALKRVLDHVDHGTKEQRAFAAQVDKLWLNKNTEYNFEQTKLIGD